MKLARTKKMQKVVILMFWRMIFENHEQARPELNDKECWSSNSKSHMQHFVASLYQLTSPTNACTYADKKENVCHNLLRNMCACSCFPIFTSNWQCFGSRWNSIIIFITFQPLLSLFHIHGLFSSKKMSLEQPVTESCKVSGNKFSN